MAKILSEVYTNPIVGISFLNDRQAVIDEINSMGGFFPNVGLHFLGMYNLEEIAGWPKEVVSCDTIKPFKAAFYNYTLEECPRGLGKWSTDMVISEVNHWLLYRNLSVMHTALGGRK